ncbi:ATP-binding protein [Streptomyces anulatus]|uniref:ATP-binding protein n=1 Tax=Streptomyces TaxID=1883 RepID=UPI000AFDA9DB|nr:ATP-binding protein [Streptomyces sp. TSRI0395]
MTEPAVQVPGMGTVHHLDDHRPTPPADPVSLVKDPATEETSPPPKAVPQGSRIVRTGRAVRRVATHDRTRSTARFTVRHGMYVVGGGRIVARRAWEGRTAARYERMLRAAEAAGNLELATEWEERGQRFRAARHQRRMDLLSAPVKAAKGAAAGLGITAGGLLLLGIILAVANENFADLATPTLALIELIRWIVLIITVVWGPLVVIGPWAALLALWGVGRHQQAAPQWALPVRDRDGQGTPITPSIVVTAMRDLGVSTLRKAIKEMGDVGAQMLSPITIAGCGVEVDVHLPSGVSTEEIQNRRKKLAENLNRHEHEVFITIPPAPRTVRLWIADSGALDEPIGPSPLVTDPDIRADYKSGRAPWGQDLRGDAALVSLFQRMLLITGLSNQGKTASLRALALWLAFDPKVEFRIGDLKGIGDWGMFDGLATVLVQGPTDDHVLDVTEMVEEAAREMNRRLLAPEKEFHPLVVIVDEAQVAYGSGAVDDKKIPLGGAKSTSRYFRAIKAIHDQGRAVNVTTWEGTQDPTNENLPKRSREGNHIRSSLVLGTESQARMAVGDAAIDGGAAPHKLRQGLDKGTVVVAGDGIKLSPGQTSVTVRTHYIDGDQAAEIATRAKALRDGVTTVAAVDHTPERDELADIMTVLGDAPRLLTQDVLKRLAVLSKDVYGTWSFLDLKRALDGTGAEPYKSDGRMTIARDRLARHLADRDTDGSASAAE